MKVLAKNGKPLTLNEMVLSSLEKLQAKIVDLSMASGNQVIAPDEGYSLSKVTVIKPETLIPENIKKDVDIGGVVGTMKGALSGKRNVTFTGRVGDNQITVYYIEDGIFKTAQKLSGSSSPISINVDFGTTVYVESSAELDVFLPTVNGAVATNYITTREGKITTACLMYILEQ